MIFKKESIEKRIVATFIGYTLFIVALLWVLQILFLNNYYYIMKRASVMSAGKSIALNLNSDNFSDTLEKLCFHNGMCCVILDEQWNEVYSVDMLGRGCEIHSPSRFSLKDNLSAVMSGERNEQTIRIKNPHFRNDSIVCARAVTNAQGERLMIVMNAHLFPVESSKDILKSQLKLITTLLIIIALCISKFVASRLSRPIRNITQKAKRLANGDYIADYDGGGIMEIDELAETLNFSAEGLSKVEELRRELMANVSHDLKTPLTMIKAYSEMIRDITGDNKEQRNEQLEVIISEADRLTALVTDLIRISREESEIGVINSRSFDIKSMIKDITERFSATNEQYNIIFEAECSDKAYADSDRIGQVLYNLISNAINYTGEDKTVKVKLFKASEKMMRIEITDSGKGIAPEELPMIWERYYRSKNTHQRPIVGSGLGLSIVKSALTAQQLPFGVQSEQGKGSCFWFELPVSNKIEMR